MDIINAIRLFILLVAGLAIILFPENVYRFQIYLIEKLHIKYNAERDRKYYTYFGIILIIISIILFIFSISRNLW